MDHKPRLLSYLSDPPHELAFGTSGLRGLVRDMTDLEVYINVRGYLEYLLGSGGLSPGEPIAIARDLREVDPSTGLSSSPRIAAAVVRAVFDSAQRSGAPSSDREARSAAVIDSAQGFSVVNCGKVPTPALACHALSRRLVGIMITGSHIPADRNGVKFYKKDGEVLKSDEPGILSAVAAVRAREYAKGPEQTAFDRHGMFQESPSPNSPDTLAPPDPAAEQEYAERYLSLFPAEEGLPLRGERLVCYQHSAVGRDLLVRILSGLGATVIPVGRSDTFIPVDTEEVTEADRERYRALCAAHQPTALVSTDGDSDRPLVVDERGEFHRGDALGILVTEFLGARFCAVPISTTDALDRWAAARAPGEPQVEVRHTRIGSPYVIRAMNEALARGASGVVAWEANGGYLLGTDFQVHGRTLPLLPTRDAMLPILAALLLKRARGLSLSALFASLPARATEAGLLDDFPVERSRALLSRLLPADRAVVLARFSAEGVTLTGADGASRTLVPGDAEAGDLLDRREAVRALLSGPSATGLDSGPLTIAQINYLDGVRVGFSNGDVIHLRPSGNAPQMRVYSMSDSPERAAALVNLGLLALKRDS